MTRSGLAYFEVAMDIEGARPNRRSFMTIFGAIFGVVLFGYAAFGRAFAYVSIPIGFPLYIGELALLIGMVSFFFTMTRFRPAFRSPVVKIYVVYALLGLLQTIPYLGKYKLDAVRDAAMWYYGIFMIFVVTLLISTVRVNSLFNFLRKAAFPFACWVVLSTLTFKQYGFALPIPGSAREFYVLKGGDQAVLMAGIFMLLLIQRDLWEKKQFQYWVYMIFTGLALLLPLTRNRGGLLGTLLALSLFFYFRPIKKMIGFMTVGLVLLTLVSIVTDEVGSVVIKRERQLSPLQVVENIESIFLKSDKEGEEGTKEWRLNWWTKIVNDVVLGKYFFIGRGNGVNLAFLYDIDLGNYENDPTRSPHSIHFTVLARYGVPGLLIWLTLLYLFVRNSFKAIKIAKKYDHDRLENMNILILCWWIVSIVNGSFDVYIEGPMGGIWFWSIMGTGVVLQEAAFALESTVLERRRKARFKALSARRSKSFEPVKIPA